MELDLYCWRNYYHCCWASFLVHHRGFVSVAFVQILWCYWDTRYFCSNSPDKNTFLTAEQTALVQRRIETDRGDSEFDPLTREKFVAYVWDFKLWGFALCFMCSTTASYAISFFLPTILRGLDYSVRDSQLLVCSQHLLERQLILTLYTERSAICRHNSVCSLLLHFVGSGRLPRSFLNFQLCFVDHWMRHDCLHNLQRLEICRDLCSYGWMCL